MSKPLVVIPARLAAQRLPNKPLLKIQGDPMIVHVWKRALEANLGPVLVACCGHEIADVIHQAGGRAIVTDPNLPSGTDRVFAAVQAFDPDHRFDTIINLQGDLPFITPASLQAVMEPFGDPDVDITSIAAPIHNKVDILNPNVVKIALAVPSGEKRGRALYFSRQAIPYQAAIYYHHIGVYGYRRQALEQFVAAQPTELERVEKLEQLRALELGLRIDVQIVREIPDSVDTSLDLDKFS